MALPCFRNLAVVWQARYFLCALGSDGDSPGLTSGSSPAGARGADLMLPRGRWRHFSLTVLLFLSVLFLLPRNAFCSEEEIFLFIPENPRQFLRLQDLAGAVCLPS